MPSTLGLVEAAKVARDLGCTTIQIFAGDPETFSPKALDPRAISTFRSLIHQMLMHSVVVHAPLVINLATTDPGHYRVSLKLLRRTLQIAAQVHANFVVLHPGRPKGPNGTSGGVLRLAQGITQAVQEAKVKLTPTFQILIENGAGKRELGKTPADLLDIVQALPDHLRPFTGICLDLAHAWAAGYDLSAVDEFQRLFGEVDETLGASSVKLIHLNNAKDPCGSYQDRHARWGDTEGQMPLTVVSSLQQDRRFRGVPLILETPLLQQEGRVDWNEERNHLCLVKQALCSGIASLDSHGSRHKRFSGAQSTI
jgi:deoxyribonuclease-4